MSKLLKHVKSKSGGNNIDLSNERLESYPTDPLDYNIQGRIGKGAFASVYVALSKSKGIKVAIKVIELERDNDDDDNDKDKQINFEEIQKEARIMTRMNHINIVRCLASFAFKTELWLVMPFMQGGSLSDLMKNSDKFKMGVKDECIVATIMKDILSGVAYCHQDGRVHRDIKAANVLLSSSGVAQLSDFGVSGAIIEGGLRKNGRHTFTGSLWWMAPEVLQRENKHSYPADIWSLGITALEISFGKPPHAKQRPVKVMLTILQQPAPTIQSCIKEKDINDQPQYKNIYGKKMKDFLNKALQKDPSKRSSAKELLNHGFLKLSKDASYIKEKLVLFAKLPKITNDLPRSISEIRRNNPTNNNDIINNGDNNESKINGNNNGNNINDTNNDNNSDNKDNNDNNDDIEFDFSTGSIGKNVKQKSVGRFLVNVEAAEQDNTDNNDNSNSNNDDNGTSVKMGRFNVTQQE